MKIKVGVRIYLVVITKLIIIDVVNGIRDTLYIIIFTISILMVTCALELGTFLNNDFIFFTFFFGIFHN